MDKECLRVNMRYSGRKTPNVAAHCRCTVIILTPSVLGVSGCMQVRTLRVTFWQCLTTRTTLHARTLPQSKKMYQELTQILTDSIRYWWNPSDSDSVPDISYQILIQFLIRLIRTWYALSDSESVPDRGYQDLIRTIRFWVSSWRGISGPDARYQTLIKFLIGYQNLF